MRADTDPLVQANFADLRAIACNCIRSYATELAPEPASIASRIDGPTPRALLFDVYGTLLISASGDVGTAVQRGPDVAFAETITEVLADEGTPHGRNGTPGVSDERLMSIASRARDEYFRQIRVTHEALRERGLAYPELEIRTVWQSVFETLASEDSKRRRRSATAHEAAHLFRKLEQAPSQALITQLAITYEMKANPVWPMPGVGALLQRAREMKLPLGIVSNAQFFTPILLETLLGSSLQALGFADELCAWSYRAGVAKPGVELFLPVLESLRTGYGVDAEDVLYIGNDIRNDITPAKQLGMRTGLFAGDARSLRLRADSLERASVQPDLIIAQWSDLRSMLIERDRQ